MNRASPHGRITSHRCTGMERTGLTAVVGLSAAGAGEDWRGLATFFAFLLPPLPPPPTPSHPLSPHLPRMDSGISFENALYGDVGCTVLYLKLCSDALFCSPYVLIEERTNASSPRIFSFLFDTTLGSLKWLRNATYLPASVWTHPTNK